MAVPTIPSAIALTNIQTEFGGSDPIAINEYYAGGTYVASGTANATSVSIPTSGTIAFSNFSGATAGFLPFVNAFYIYDVWITTALVSVRWGSLGSVANIWTPVSYTTCNVAEYTYNSINAPSTYDLRVTKTGGTGTLSGITNNTWTRLSTNVTVTLSRSTLGISTVNTTISIKYNANSTIIDSNACHFEVERKFGK